MMIRRNRAEEIVADQICQREWDANCARVLFRGWPAAAGHNAATATSRDATTNHGARTPTRVAPRTEVVSGVAEKACTRTGAQPVHGDG